MKRIILATVLLMLSSSFVLAEQRDWQGVETALGRKGTVQEDMLKVSFPRADLKVTVGEVPVEPGLALTSWIGFKGTEKNAMMMGDLVLLEREVSPVMTQLVAKGIEVTALHNHILNESPTVMYLHFSGNGDPRNLPKQCVPHSPDRDTNGGATTCSISQTTAIDWTKVEAIFAKTGQKKGNLFQLSFPRKETIKEHGMDVPPYMGMATGINMQDCRQQGRNDRDFVLLATR